MKFWNINICLTSRKSIMVIISLLLSTIVIASVWIPTAEDIAYQDSMYTIIQSTQNDITDIKNDIVHILERLDYADGTWDSIRYVKGGAIDKRRNK